MHDQAVLDRVRKLLALASSPNVHEAAVAAARAQRLVAAHRLEGWLRADPSAPDPDPIVDARDAPLDSSRRLRRWRVALAVALAELNGCVAYTLDRRGARDLVLVGRAADRAAVRALYEGLVRRIEWLSATHGAGQDKRWHEAFRIGVVDAVRERLGAEPEAPDALEPGQLARVDQARAAHRDRLERFTEERLRLRPGRALRVDARAWELGRDHGRTLDLPEG